MFHGVCALPVTVLLTHPETSMSSPASNPVVSPADPFKPGRPPVLWRGKWRAFCIHLLISLGVAILAALLVFGLWFPYPYRELAGGRQLFLLLLGVDVVVGPLLTFVVFNPRKRLREKALDFTVIGLLQLGALGYGLWSVAQARPVHLVYEYSRLAVVTAAQVPADQLEKAPPGLRALPWTGPTLLSLRPFKDASEQFEFTMAAASGVPQAAQTELWQPYDAGRIAILETARPLDGLKTKHPNEAALIDRAIVETGKPADRLLYMPVLSRDTAWSVLIDAETALPVGFVPLDPYP